MVLIHENAAIKPYSACSRDYAFKSQTLPNVDSLFRHESFAEGREIFAQTADQVVS